MALLSAFFPPFPSLYLSLQSTEYFLHHNSLVFYLQFSRDLTFFSHSSCVPERAAAAVPADESVLVPLLVTSIVAVAIVFISLVIICCLKKKMKKKRKRGWCPWLCFPFVLCSWLGSWFSDCPADWAVDSLIVQLTGQLILWLSSWLGSWFSDCPADWAVDSLISPADWAVDSLIGQLTG